MRFKLPNSENWASFACTKNLLDNLEQRVYIVRTNDHSKKEALFTGTIPTGSYGAGKLIKVDGGHCEIIRYSNTNIIINFKGSKFKGMYHLINTAAWGRGRGDYSRKIYAFFKAKED